MLVVGAVVEVVDVVGAVEVVVEELVVVGLVVVVVGAVVEVVLDVLVEELDEVVAGTVSVGDEPSSLRSARKINNPAASRMATTRATRPPVAQPDRRGGTGAFGPPGPGP